MSSVPQTWPLDLINLAFKINPSIDKNPVGFLQLCKSAHISCVCLSFVLVQESEDRYSPLLTVNGPGEEKLFRSKSAEVELTVEKERVKKMLSEG